MRRYLVVWNPSAGQKAGMSTNRTDEDQIRRLMDAHGLGSDLYISQDLDASRRRLRRAVSDAIEVVVAAGGDGTVGVVAEAVIGSRTAIGILPLGSAMNMARSLGIPRDIDAAAHILATGEIATIDVGRASDGLFLEVASIGMNAALLGQAHLVAEGRREGLAGAIAAILRYRPTAMTIALDSSTVRTRALTVAVANAPFTGVGLTLAPEARLDDGYFDVAVFRDFSKVELLRHLASIVAGRRRHSPKVQTYRSKSVRIETARSVPARADDRDLGGTPLDLAVIPHALRVVVPARHERAAPAAGGPAIAGVAGSM